MGVLRCNRRGCENIMCDRYSNEYGYICSNCFEELLKQPDTSIAQFMNSEKPKFDFDIWECYCNSVFKEDR